MDPETTIAARVAPLGEDARWLCQALLRMDTTNPPGNERLCADLLAHELAEVGYRPELVEPAPGRANLIVRYRGTGAKSPLLLTAHLDVVEPTPLRGSGRRSPARSTMVACGVAVRST
jgi:acetylornithine deacetylase/succinyl-diaminopimelate desuccinylase-like protein